MPPNRPFIKYSIDQLEAEYERASSAGDLSTLKTLLDELTPRKTSRAKDLLIAVEQFLGGNSTRNSRARQPENRTPDQPRQRQPIRHQRLAKSKSKHNPTSEQYHAIEAFLKGGSLKINAYAGTGKTSTLEMLAHSTSSRGQYIAFNRDIVEDAKGKFPDTVECSTTHSMAFKATPFAYKNSSKMTGKMNAHMLAGLLDLKKSWRVDKDHTLKPVSQGSLILKTLQRYMQSADPEPVPRHVPRHGVLLAAPEPTIKAVEDFAVHGASHVWDRMKIPNDPIPLGHDGYLKLWALSDPFIAADFILLDEAQDTNPVVLDVLRRQTAQMIYVGDKYQQIYEWRGAVNAMGVIETDFTTYLTKSFRFGESIAEAATNVLKMLGEKNPIRGNPDIKSIIGPTNPRTILARTNATTITALIDALDRDLKPHLVGGNGEIMEMLRGVQDLKRGEPSTVPDFFGFENWTEVVEFARSEEGEHLLTFVNLVESRGERQLMWALNRTVKEDDCDIIISTAHKAKGREWPKVKLMDDFLKSKPRRLNQYGTSGHDSAELRLFYVAMTRAREEMEIASNVLSLIGVPVTSTVHAPPRPATPRSQTDPSAGMTKSPPATQPRTEWTPPKNWEPESKPVRPQHPRTVQVEPTQPPKKKGILDWLFFK